MKRIIFRIKFITLTFSILVIGLALFYRCANTFNIDIVSELGVGVSDFNNNSVGDLFAISNNEWLDYTINILDLNLDSIKSIGFSPVHRGTEREGIYIDLIRIFGDSDTLIVEDFENYNLGSTTIEEGLDDRYWGGGAVYNGTNLSVTIVNEYNNKFLKFEYSNFMGNEVICDLLLIFRNPQNWSNYHTYSLSMKRIP